MTVREGTDLRAVRAIPGGELREGHQVLIGQGRGGFVQERPAAIGDLIFAPLDGLQQPCSLQVVAGPMDPAVEDGLVPAGYHLPALVLGEPELIAQPVPQAAGRVCRAVLDEGQHGQQELLVCGDRHLKPPTLRA